MRQALVVEVLAVLGEATATEIAVASRERCATRTSAYKALCHLERAGCVERVGAKRFHGQDNVVWRLVDE